MKITSITRDFQAFSALAEKLAAEVSMIFIVLAHNFCTIKNRLQAKILFCDKRLFKDYLPSLSLCGSLKEKF